MDEADSVSPSEELAWPVAMLVRMRAFEALRHRDYRLLWYGQIFGSMGTWMDQVTRGWLIYELTNSALQLGLVRGIQAIPFLLLSPIAGSAADRYPRKFQVVSAQFASGFLYAVTAALVLTGLIRPWHVYVTAFLMACVQVFLQPSRSAMISDFVPQKTLTSAIGLNAMVFNMARSTGPALSGMLISLSSTGISYAVQALFMILATVWTTQLSKVTPGDPSSHGSHDESFGQSIIEGWKFSWRTPEVRTGILIVIVAALFMIPFSTLLPVFARDLLLVGARGQGLLLTAMGIGALCSSILIASVGDRMPRGLLMLGGVALYGVLVVIFSVSPLVSVVDGADGDHRLVPCQLACVGADRHSNLFAARVSRPGHRDFPHDPGIVAGWRYGGGRVISNDRRALGGVVHEHRRHALHGGDLRHGAAGAGHSLASSCAGAVIVWLAAELLRHRFLRPQN